MLELFWPVRCVGCGERSASALCLACARLSPGEGEVHGVPVVFAGPYSGAIAAMIRRTKTQGDRRLACVIATWVAEELAQPCRQWCPTAVVPAPSPWTRRIRRGFSLSHLIAHALSLRLGVPLVDVLRQRPGARQASRGRVGRRENLQGRIRSAGEISGRVIWVDDVMTTGATAERCCEELLGSGAEAVLYAVACRVMPSDDSECRDSPSSGQSRTPERDL